LFISTEYPFNKYIHVFHNGEELHTCIWFDTKDQEAMCIGFEHGERRHIYKNNKITFKIERGKNIPEPFFTELTTDDCFAGFID